MKQNKIAALIALISVFSCEKGNDVAINVIERTDAPIVETSSTNDIFIVGTDDGSEKTGYQFLDKFVPIEINSNITITTQEIGEYYKDCHLGNEEHFGGAFWIGENTARFYYKKNGGYTYDTAMMLGQTIFTSRENHYEWADFKNYGPVEKYINFRVMGAKGTLYIEDYIEDLEKIVNGGKGRNGETSEEQLNNNPYYVRGILKDIASGKDFESKLIGLRLYDNYFSNGGFYPSVTTCKGVSKVFTIESEGEDYTISITGRERDNDLVNLSNYVKVGNIVEIAIKDISKNIVESKNLGEAIYCRVLKVTD